MNPNKTSEIKPVRAWAMVTDGKIDIDCHIYAEYPNREESSNTEGWVEVLITQIQEDRQVEELTWKEKHGQVTNELSETGGRLMMQSFKNADLEKEKEALQERVRECEKQLRIAMNMYMSDSADDEDWVKWYELSEKKLSQPDQNKSSKESK